MTTPETPVGRYGPAASPRRRRRIVVIFSVLGAVVVIAAAWLALGGNQSTPVSYDTYGFKVVSSERTDVTLTVDVKKNTAVTCTVEAQDSGHGQVGTRKVKLAPSSKENNRYTVPVRTSAKAVTGFVDGCHATS
jgi:uncharacterized protein (DUF58 family)